MYFIANWKMFGGVNSLNSLDKVIKFVKSFKKKKLIQIIYCPPNTLINLMSRKFRNININVGSQNCHEQKDYGPYTGSVNCRMLKNAGAKYVIIGHSEVRQSGESNELINKKIQTAIKSGLKVIFCVGETIQQKRKKLTKKVLSKQIKLGLNNVKNKKNIIIAYEPVWSIGTGIIPKPLELLKTINFLKKKLKYNKILYGGSVNSKNINQLKPIYNLDGYLIGGASQDPKKFIDIIKKTYN